MLFFYIVQLFSSKYAVFGLLVLMVHILKFAARRFFVP